MPALDDNNVLKKVSNIEQLNHGGGYTTTPVTGKPARLLVPEKLHFAAYDRFEGKLRDILAERAFLTEPISFYLTLGLRGIRFGCNRAPIASNDCHLSASQLYAYVVTHTQSELLLGNGTVPDINKKIVPFKFIRIFIYGENLM